MSNEKIKLVVTENQKRLHIGSFFSDLNETDYQELIKIFADQQTLSLQSRIKELEDERKWISVEDSLPFKDGNSDILCLVYGKSIDVCIRSFNEHYIVWDDEDMDDYFTDAKGGKITHWMPLPTFKV